MVALEAMIAGVPVITARRAGPAYVLAELGCYPPHPGSAPVDADGAEYAAALQVARDAPQALAAAGLQRAQQEFSITALAARLDDLLINAGPRG